MVRGVIKMRKKKIRNPLFKRIPKEIIGDWKKYLVVCLFLVLTIGFVSGMYVANNSMMKAVNESSEKYKLENGHFELDKKAGDKLIAAIETGEKADIKKYYLDKAKKKFDKNFDSEFEKKFTDKFEKKFRENYNKKIATLYGEEYKNAYSDIYQKAYNKAYKDAYKKAWDKAYPKAYDKAWDKVVDKVNDKYKDAEDKYELNDSI